MIEQTKCTDSLLGKVLEKQTKTIQDQGIKQIEILKAFEPEDNQGLESIEGIFPKKSELIKLKKKYNRLSILRTSTGHEK